MRHPAIGASALLLLSACADPASFYGEAGRTSTDPGFGSAVIRNIGVSNGEIDAMAALNTRFAAEVPTTINFAFNSAALDAQAQAILRQQASWIRQFPEVRFRVYGHTDLVGSDAYNRRLGQRRAEAAVAFLVASGIGRARLEAVVSYGETQPLVVTQGRERANRRTVTEVSGFVGRHPTVLNGRYAEVVFREYVESATMPQQIGGVQTITAEAAQ